MVEYLPVAFHGVGGEAYTCVLKVNVRWEEEFMFRVTRETSVVVLGLHEPVCPGVLGRSPKKPAPAPAVPPWPSASVAWAPPESCLSLA